MRNVTCAAVASPAGAIHAPAASPAAKAAAASNSVPPRTGAADVYVRSMVLGITPHLYT